jgi:hypothetical protein
MKKYGTDVCQASASTAHFCVSNFYSCVDLLKTFPFYVGQESLILSNTWLAFFHNYKPVV